MIEESPLVIDSGIISRYGLIHRFDILEKLFCDELIIPTEVLKETIIVPPLKQSINKAIRDGWVKEFTITLSEHPKIFEEYIQLEKRFDPGESACMAIALHHGCTVASDDMRATVKFCKKHNIPLIGSLGILYKAFHNKIVDKDEAQLLLDDMIKKSNYKSPVITFQEVINWFRKREGRQIY